MSEPEPWVGPGVVLTFGKVHKTSNVTEEILERWFIEEYGPGLLATGVVKGAWPYRAANPEYDKQRLFVYKISDLAAVHAGKMRAVPRTSKKKYFEGELDDHVEFESRIYSLVQLYETSEQDKDAADTIMLAMMQPPPGGELALDLWYRDEHNEQMSQEPGWKRTTRFKHLFTHGNLIKESQELSCLAIHEFNDGNKLGKDVKPLEPMSDWTKKIMSEAKGIDAAIFNKCKLAGEDW